jgi:hypothetical protein
MAKVRSRHSADTKGPRRRFSRGDLAILLCGVLAFLSITFGAPLFNRAHTVADGSGLGSPAATGSVATRVPSPGTAPLAATGTAENTSASVQFPDSHALEPALPQAAEPRRIRYASAGFDVPVHRMELDGAAQSSQTIVPPETKDGYWLAPFGVPGDGSANTTYVIGHSWDGADAPFNHLSSAARVRDRLEVDTSAGSISYQVESVTTYLKSHLKDSPIWEIVPNRLVLISCYTEDPWGKNVVVTASPLALGDHTCPACSGDLERADNGL